MALSIVYAQQYAFVHFVAHPYVDGQVVELRRALEDAFNGFATVHYLDEDNFAYFVGELETPPEDPDTDAEIRSFDVTYFTGVFYAGIGDLDIVQDQASGDLLQMHPENYTDAYIYDVALP